MDRIGAVDVQLDLLAGEGADSGWWDQSAQAVGGSLVPRTGREVCSYLMSILAVGRECCLFGGLVLGCLV